MPPQFVIHVQAQEAYLHCGRAVHRARRWKRATAVIDRSCGVSAPVGRFRPKAEVD